MISGSIVAHEPHECQRTGPTGWEPCPSPSGASRALRQVWRFSSRANRAAFREDPPAYAPRLGGYDAAGILEGRLVDADPLVFAVIGERLYLFRDGGRRARFQARTPSPWPPSNHLYELHTTASAIEPSTGTTPSDWVASTNTNAPTA